MMNILRCVVQWKEGRGKRVHALWIHWFSKGSSKFMELAASNGARDTTHSVKKDKGERSEGRSIITDAAGCRIHPW